MRPWIVATAMGVMLVVGAGALQASTAEPREPGQVMARPQWGDRAELLAVTEGLSDGEEMRDRTRSVVEWHVTEFEMPAGEQVSLIARTARFQQTDNDTATMATFQQMVAPIPLDAGVSTATAQETVEVSSDLVWSVGFRELDEGVIVTALAGEGTEQNPADGTSAWMGFTWVDIVEPDPCTSDWAARIGGLPAAEAEAVFARCVETNWPEAFANTTIASRWEEHPHWGMTWVLETTSASTDEDGDPSSTTRTVRTSPALSFPLQVTTLEAASSPEGVWNRTNSLTLVGWEPGTRPLPGRADELPPQPTIQMVEWDEDGPVEGDLEGFPFRAAKETERERFEESPGMVLLTSWYSEDAQHAPPRPGSPFLFGCGRGEEVRTPLSVGAYESWWLQTWLSESDVQVVWARGAHASLLGVAHPHVFYPEFPEASASASWGGLALPPATSGPHLQALREASWLVDSRVPGGSLDLLLGREWYVNGSTLAATPVLAGSISRTACELAGSTFRALHAQVTFGNGTATSWFRAETVAETNESYFPALPLGGPPRTPPGEHEPPPIPPPLLGLAGVALLGGGLASSPALRVVPGLYTRLTSAEVLESERRARVLDVVRARPGRNLKGVASEVGLHRSTVRHHLSMLERMGFVALTKTPGGLVAHPSGDARIHYAPVLERAHARRSLEIVRARPGLTVSELADAIGVTKSRVSPLTQELEKAGLVTRRPDGRSLRVYAVET